MAYPHIINPITFTAPTPIVKKFTNLLDAFDTYIWVYLMISILSLMVSVYLMSKIHVQKIDNKWPVLYKILEKPDHSYNKLNLHNKIIMYTWTFMCLVLMSAFSGCMHSLMSVKFVNKVETLTALVSAMHRGHVQILGFKMRPYTYLFNVSNIIITL